MTDHVNQETTSLRFFNDPAMTNKQPKPFGLQFVEDMNLPNQEKPMDATFSSGPSPTNCGGPDSSVDVDLDI